MKLSIITINLNNAEGLRKTIESVINQIFTDFEYIVIDGASTDGSVDVINKYASWITFWVSEKDSGVYSAMNKGILQARGEYLLFMNSGDWFYSSFTLQNVFNLLRTEDILYGDSVLYKDKFTPITLRYPKNLTAHYLINSMPCHQAIFHKRSLFENDKFDEKYSIVADWEFILRMCVHKNASSYKIDQIIACCDGNGISSICENVNEERQHVLHTLFPKMILDDYMNFEKLNKLFESSTLSPYLKIFLTKPKLQRFIKRIMKLSLYLTNNKELIP
jgi:glycosyltransferase involved in cell wall biosynthesis